MKGLLMIEELYNQTILGNKTQTRREGSLKAINDNPDEWRGVWRYANEEPNDSKVNWTEIFFNNKKDLDISCKPRLKVGEVVYLKEPYMFAFNTVYYRFSEFEGYGFIRHPEIPIITKDKKWKNKLFMPESAAREFVKITGIRCDRLLEISDEDCEAEGIEISERGAEFGFKYYIKTNTSIENMVSHFNSFISLFKYANKVKEVPNLWVWVYEFARCDREGGLIS
jgi:hypothetical protein